MNTYEEKIALLMEMIVFSVVDGRLHEREYEFLSLVAHELRIEKTVFNDLFHQEFVGVPIKTESQRIQQFYRLALLMHVDGILHEKEEIAIRQIAINMGLNPSVTQRILRMIKESPTRIIDSDLLLDVFKEQHN